MLQQINRMVQFLWVPAHTGVSGNEEVDQLAKQVMTKENIDMQILYSKAELKSIIKKGINTNWQLFWDNELKGRHLYSVQPMVGRGRNSRGRRKEACVISRLRLGHTGLNSTLHIIGKHPTGLCDWCGVKETVEHVIIQCKGYMVERSKLIVELQKNGEQQVTLKEILNPVGDSLLTQSHIKTYPDYVGPKCKT